MTGGMILQDLYINNQMVQGIMQSYPFVFYNLVVTGTMVLSNRASFGYNFPHYAKVQVPLYTDLEPGKVGKIRATGITHTSLHKRITSSV